MAPSIYVREPVDRIDSKARGCALPAGPQARKSQQRWPWSPPPLAPPRPLAATRRLLPYRGSAVSAAGWLRVRPPRTPDQVAAGSALPAVWVPAGSLHPSAQGPGCLGSTRSSRRRPSPDARGEGGDTGRGGGNGGVGWGEARLSDPRGGGGAESHGRGAGAFLPAQATSVQLTAAAGSERLPRTACTGRGSVLGGQSARVPAWPSTLSPGSQFPPGTRGACLILV